MPKYPSNANICIDCKRALGGCSWSEIDIDTKKVRFEPIPGWTAKKSSIGNQQVGKHKRRIETYHITACPQFVRG